MVTNEQPILSRVEITGLHGFLTHVLDIQNPISIVYSPNGFGKTTIFKLLFSIFTSKIDDLSEVEFKTVSISTTSGATLQISKHIASSERADSVIRFTYSPKRGVRSEQYDLNVSRSAMRNRHIRSSMLEDYVPHLERVGQKEWLDKSIGDILTMEDVARRYSDYLPNSILSRLGFDIPRQISEFLNSVKVRFIQTQRLLTEDEAQRDIRGPRRKRVSTVSACAIDLANEISRSLASYANESQKLDSSFPRRLIEHKLYGLSDDYESIFKRLQDLLQKRDELVRFRLIDASHELISIGNPADIEGLERELTIYVNDSEEKMSQFDNLLTRLKLFRDIINSKFQFKRIEISREEGFVIKNNKSLPIPSDALSSGEQHELIMLYDMIFKTDNQTLLLIDEPEISLHVAWQHRFLTDLEAIRDVNGFTALIATHSPQIIKGRWDLSIDLGEGAIK